jgi:hypothetical protein
MVEWGTDAPFLAIFIPTAHENSLASTSLVNVSCSCYCMKQFLMSVVLSPSIIRMIKSRRMRWAGQVSQMGEKTNTYRILLGKAEGKRPLGRPRCGWVDNVKMDLREIG